MSFRLINNIEVQLRKVRPEDVHPLAEYLSLLGPVTRSRFGPHGFDTANLLSLYEPPSLYTGYVALERQTQRVIAYAVVKKGFLAHDAQRLQSYGLVLNEETDATYAPSVADDWQGRGLGTALFDYIKSDLSHQSIRRIILWGGVQASNVHAIGYYQKLGFTTLGAFEYQGSNFDMILPIAPDTR
jgi:GNAT superfamily N-acetyltransferase